MTIKQQGGIFGRNPSFNDADLSGDLTVEGTSNLSGDLSVGGTSQLTGDVAIGLASASSALHVYSPSSLDQITIDGNAGDNRGISLRSENSVRWNFYVNGAAESGGNAGSDLTIARYSDAGGYLGAAMAFERSSGKITAYGNLAFTSGKGIDFSATSGTGTSELFDDYEEGTWTPQLYDSSSTGGNLSPTSGTGFYTKVGNTVTVWCSFINISTSGMTAGNTLWVHGFPYSNGTVEGIGAVNCDTLNFGTGKTNVVVFMYPSNALALLKQTGDNVSDANTIVSDITSGTTDVSFTVTYKV